MPAPLTRGRFVWHELMTSNPDAAAAFYGKVIGWKTQPWPQDPSYRTWLVGKTPVGGLMALPDQAKLAGAPPHWMSYIGVADVDAAVRKATSLGAHTHVAPRDIPGAGRFAVLVDPQGATFAVYASSEPEGEQPDMGGFSWHELATTDPAAGWKFYQTLFGWEHTSTMDMGEDGPYIMFGFGSVAIGGLYKKPLELPMPNWLPYIQVPKADDTSKAAARAGGRVLNGPMDVPGGDRIVVLLDPQGAAIAVHTKVVAKPKKKATKKKATTKKQATAKKKPAAKKKKPAKKNRR